MRPRYTDKRKRYRTAAETREPGYLARRFAAILRLQRMKSRAVVTNLTERKKAHG